MLDHRPAGARVPAGSERADRRDRGGQVDPARCAGLRAGLARAGRSGARGRGAGRGGGRVRPGPRPPARAVLDEAGLPGGRADPAAGQHADGRKTAWVNDRRASGEVLRALSDTLVELHGQQDDRGLLNPRNHRACSTISGGSRRTRSRRARPGARARGRKRPGSGRGAAGGDAARGGFPAPRGGGARGARPRQGEEAELDAAAA
jgi:hypothetical protein